MSKLYVVGIGPGGYEQMTVKAVKVLEECDIIGAFCRKGNADNTNAAGRETLQNGI